MTPNDIISEVKKTVDYAHQIFPIIMPMPAIELINRGTKGGSAHYHKHVVKFHEILAKENPNEFHNTIKHEIAHLIAFRMYGEKGKGHGKLFKSVFIKLGGNGKRTHSYKTSHLKQKYTCRRYEYSCKCPGKFFWLSQQKHNQLVSNKKQWFCRKCHTLSFTGNMKETVK